MNNDACHSLKAIFLYDITEQTTQRLFNTDGGGSNKNAQTLIKTEDMNQHQQNGFDIYMIIHDMSAVDP